MITTFKQALVVHDHETNALHHFQREAQLLDRLDAAREQLKLLAHASTTRPEWKGLLAEMATL